MLIKPGTHPLTSTASLAGHPTFMPPIKILRLAFLIHKIMPVAVSPIFLKETRYIFTNSHLYFSFHPPRYQIRQ